MLAACSLHRSRQRRRRIAHLAGRGVRSDEPQRQRVPDAEQAWRNLCGDAVVATLGEGGFECDDDLCGCGHQAQVFTSNEYSAVARCFVAANVPAVCVAAYPRLPPYPVASERDGDDLLFIVIHDVARRRRRATPIARIAVGRNQLRASRVRPPRRSRSGVSRCSSNHARHTRSSQRMWSSTSACSSS